MTPETTIRFAATNKRIDEILVALRTRNVAGKLEQFRSPKTKQRVVHFIPGLVERAGRTTRFFLSQQREPPPRYAFVYESEALTARLGKNKACVWQGKSLAPLSSKDSALLRLVEELYILRADRRMIAKVAMNGALGLVILGLLNVYIETLWVNIAASASVLCYLGAYVGEKFEFWSGSRGLHEGFARRNCWTPTDMNSFAEKLEFARFCKQFEHPDETDIPAS